ncbi:Os05g0445200 [Oryza sativa Japonica Group]|uniref:Os05g0445200 protein n=1 Tax=Oryza sativa subsp. japonica TaxID=39947 RepID=A0A0P0WMW3_ORYSJ|nr:Os05g0445200 [Oryza sativa Japonica Group]
MEDLDDVFSNVCLRLGACVVHSRRLQLEGRQVASAICCFSGDLSTSALTFFLVSVNGFNSFSVLVVVTPADLVINVVELMY